MCTKYNVDIFDLSVSNEEKKFVNEALLLESEVVSDIVEKMKEIPWLGSLIKLGMVGKGFMDLRFIWKIGRFLKKSEDIDQEKKVAFLAKLDKKDRKRMYEYLMQLLYTAEEERKADIMGMVYRERIMNNIDNEMFLRLCYAINRVYIDDIDRLEVYAEMNTKNDHVTNNLYASGLLNMTNSVFEGESLSLGGAFVLSEVGKQLLRIMKE